MLTLMQHGWDPITVDVWVDLEKLAWRASLARWFEYDAFAETVRKGIWGSLDN